MFGKWLTIVFKLNKIFKLVTEDELNIFLKFVYFVLPDSQTDLRIWEAMDCIIYIYIYILTGNFHIFYSVYHLIGFWTLKHLREISYLKMNNPIIWYKKKNGLPFFNN